jgi:hypothetical protein
MTHASGRNLALLTLVALVAIALLPADALAHNCSGGVDCLGTGGYLGGVLAFGSAATTLVILTAPEDATSSESGAGDSFVIPGDTPDTGLTGSSSSDGTASDAADGRDLTEDFERALFGDRGRTTTPAAAPNPPPAPPRPRPVIDIPLGGDPRPPTAGGGGV